MKKLQLLFLIFFLLLTISFGGSAFCTQEEGRYEDLDFTKDFNEDGRKWHYCHLRSDEDTAISLDYQINRPDYDKVPSGYVDSSNYQATTSQLFINVQNQNFTGNEKARAVFITKYSKYELPARSSRPIHTLYEKTYQVDLQFVPEEKKFIGSLDNIFITNLTHRSDCDITGFCGSQQGHLGCWSVPRPCWQEFAIVIDGKWLKDPISQTNNFKLDLLAPF